MAPFELRKFKNFADVLPHEVPPFIITMGSAHVPVRFMSPWAQQARNCNSGDGELCSDVWCNDEVARTSEQL